MKRLGLALCLAGAAGCEFPPYVVRADADGGMAAAGQPSLGASGGASLGGTGVGGAAGGTGGTVAGAFTEGASGDATGTFPLGQLASDWRMTFQDDFDASQLDTSKWNTVLRLRDTSFREWGGRQEFVADENVHVENGACVITAENRPSGGHPFTSGALNSAGHFAQEYGYFEARLKVPSGNGFWSVWSLTSLDGWPPAIYGVEVFGAKPDSPYFSFWWQGSTATEHQSYQGAADYSNAYHVYGIDWQKAYLAFFVDGMLIKRWNNPDTQLSGPLSPSINLSIPTADSGNVVPDGTTPWPGQLQIDWIRVYVKTH